MTMTINDLDNHFKLLNQSAFIINAGIIRKHPEILNLIIEKEDKKLYRLYGLISELNYLHTFTNEVDVGDDEDVLYYKIDISNDIDISKIYGNDDVYAGYTKMICWRINQIRIKNGIENEPITLSSLDGIISEAINFTPYHELNERELRKWSDNARSILHDIQIIKKDNRYVELYDNVSQNTERLPENQRPFEKVKRFISDYKNVTHEVTDESIRQRESLLKLFETDEYTQKFITSFKGNESVDDYKPSYFSKLFKSFKNDFDEAVESYENFNDFFVTENEKVGRVYELISYYPLDNIENMNVLDDVKDKIILYDEDIKIIPLELPKGDALKLIIPSCKEDYTAFEKSIINIYNDKIPIIHNVDEAHACIEQSEEASYIQKSLKFNIDRDKTLLEYLKANEA